MRVCVIGLDALPPVPPPFLGPEADAKLAKTKEILADAGVALAPKPADTTEEKPKSAKGTFKLNIFFD